MKSLLHSIPLLKYNSTGFSSIALKLGCQKKNPYIYSYIFLLELCNVKLLQGTNIHWFDVKKEKAYALMFYVNFLFPYHYLFTWVKFLKLNDLALL